ncbi:ketosynthase [Pseudomarimonas salicorniae]|uniref:Ketosynthase n=1 Tax=Pseudomarimonas salicorniae TaxID=2933270 RepID=A0ABT0GEB6_9GAMM|nr:ketosynthase [Lysobacter sp. CAU 1642]MCK7592362.1 ketosynthase [Lysobacter sp. CAU 1642]
MTRLLPAVLAVTYPLLAHAAAWSGQPVWALLAGGVLVLLVLWPALARGHWLAWLSLLLCAAGLAALYQRALGTLPLFAPPVLLNAFLAWLFGRTLAAGRRPLIEQMVRVLHGEPDAIDAGVAPYARRLTALWAGLFAALAVINLILALLAVPDGLLVETGFAPPLAVPLSLWSLFANVLNYVIVAAFFLLEYAYRRRRFPDQPYRNVVDFTCRVARLGPAFWRGLVR